MSCLSVLVFVMFLGFFNRLTVVFFAATELLSSRALTASATFLVAGTSRSTARLAGPLTVYLNLIPPLQGLGACDLLGLLQPLNRRFLCCHGISSCSQMPPWGVCNLICKLRANVHNHSEDWLCPFESFGCVHGSRRGASGRANGMVD